VTAVVQGGVYLAERNNPTFGTWALGLLAVASGASLLIGFLTPVASALVGLGSSGLALSWLPATHPNLLEARLATIFIVMVAAAIIFLGPGAFSLDSYFFGRREIIIPPASGSPKF
jgi:uncharacterized membrane protein YphA (DoxX/SURF4 family)